MSNNSQVVKTTSYPIDTTSAGLSQFGDKNTQIAHAEHITINNYITTSIPKSVSYPVLNSGEQPSLNSTGSEPHPTELRLSDEYYNLFILGYEEVLEGNRFVFPLERALNEYIAKEISDLFANLDTASISKIKLLPTLFAYESQLHEHPEQEAYYGFITDIKMRENGINIYFEKLLTVSQRRLHDIAINLAIKNLEFNRTHWTIKKVNLLEELTVAGLVPSNSTGMGCL